MSRNSSKDINKMRINNTNNGIIKNINNTILLSDKEALQLVREWAKRVP